MPVTLIVCPAAPACTVGGETSVMNGAGLFVALAAGVLVIVAVADGVAVGPEMTNVSALLAPPPGEGLNTVTVALPALMMSLAVMFAVSVPPSTKVVIRLVPFQRTIELGVKFAPTTVNSKTAPPALADDGVMEINPGTRLGVPVGVAGVPTVKLSEFDVPPPGAGLYTAMSYVPAAEKSVEVMNAFSSVLETYVVERGVPSQCATESGINPDPVSVTYCPTLPVGTLLGLLVNRNGAGLATVAVGVLLGVLLGVRVGVKVGCAVAVGTDVLVPVGTGVLVGAGVLVLPPPPPPPPVCVFVAAEVSVSVGVVVGVLVQEFSVPVAVAVPAPGVAVFEHPGVAEAV